MNLQYYDPHIAGARGRIYLHEVGLITIAPYPGGFHDGELPGLMTATPELVDTVFATST